MAAQVTVHLSRCSTQTGLPAGCQEAVISTMKKLRPEQQQASQHCIRPSSSDAIKTLNLLM